MSTLPFRYIIPVLMGSLLILSPLSGYERFCEPEIKYVYVSELTDSSENIYLHGLILGEADMDPGEGSHILSANKGRSFVLKLDSEGNFIWVKQFDADINDMVLDESGKLHITGDFRGEVDFDPGEGSHLLSVENEGLFFLSLEPSGSFLEAGFLENATAGQIRLDASGAIYVSGTFDGVVDFDPGVSFNSISSNYGSNYILKLTANRDFLWVKQFESNISSIATDEAGNLFFNFEPPDGQVIGKYDDSGNLLWEKQLTGISPGVFIAVDESGRVIVTGDFQGKVDFDPGPDLFYLESDGKRKSTFVLKLDQDGSFLWARHTLGGYGSRAIADASGNLVLAGFFWDSLSTDPGGHGVVFFEEEDLPHIFILDLNPLGELLSARKKIIPDAPFYSGFKLSINKPGPESFILSGIAHEEDWDDCQNSMGFISWLNRDGTTTKDIMVDLEEAGDPFEDNDEFDMAVHMEESLLHSNLTISGDDDDWYDLSALADPCMNYHMMTIDCYFNHSEGDINMELVTSDGSVIDISASETDHEQIIYLSESSESCFLHVYLNAGSSSSYELRWEDACFIDFEDPNLLYALIDVGVDTNGDSLISTAEAGIIQKLDLSGRGISDMSGIESFSLLDTLDCSGNHLDSLDLRACQGLRSLKCDDNQLIELDISGNRNLKNLSCNQNQLSELTVLDNPDLEYLECSSNQLVTLYLNHNSQLRHLDCNSNFLKHLNLTQNELLGSDSLWGIRISNMPSLSEVCVWDQPFPPIGFQGYVDTTGSSNVYFTNVCATDTIVYIPDFRFREALLERGVDINSDRLISQSEAESVLSLHVSYAGIIQMTGIEAFINLEELYCQSNELTILDLSQNGAISSLTCSRNRLDSLDVSGNSALTTLYCNDNQLTALDVSSNSALTTLHCNDNQLTNLNVSNNSELTSLYCSNNHLTELTVSNCEELIYLDCYDNQLTTLNLDSQTELTRLDCSYNRITELDLSSLYWLEVLRCGFNQLDNLDIHTYYLSEVECNNNLLTSLDVAGTYYLEVLRCHSNQLTWIDVSYCDRLKMIHCNDNKLDSLDLEGIPRLEELQCEDNLLTSLDVSEKSQLYALGCGGNLLTSLDLSMNPYLIWLSLDRMPGLQQVCVWELPFPPQGVEVLSSGSSNLQFENICGNYADSFEENDQAEEAAFLEKAYHHQNLIVSEEDEDWYLLVNENHTTFNRIRIECNFNPLEGDIDLDLFSLEGLLLASSKNASEKKYIDYLLTGQQQCLLHVSLSSGIDISYSLYWNEEPYQPESELSVCLNGAGCSRVHIEPTSNSPPYILDSLNLELLSGDIRTETLEIRNHGTEPYFFYSALDCTSLRDSLNKAIRFNGMDSYARIRRNNALDAPEKMTIEAWIRVRKGTTNGSPIICKGFGGAGYDLYITGDEQHRRIGFSAAQTEVQSNTFLENERWYHVAATSTDQSIQLYINGILDSEVNPAGTISAVNQDLFIGTMDTRFGHELFYLGDVDEVRIWNKVRSSVEIHSFMNRELSGEEPGLIGYWPMNNGTMRALIDHASRNNAVLVGDAARIISSNPITGMIKWSPELGNIAPGSTMDYTLEINAARLKEGNYFSNIHFMSADPLVPDMILPTRISVTDAPSITVQPDSVILGELDIYKLHTRLLNVENHGSEILQIDSVRTNVVGTRITPASGTIEPGESRIFTVDLLPRNIEVFGGFLTFFSNDPNNQQLTIPITGEGKMIIEYAILKQIDDTLSTESLKFRILGFENSSSLHGLTLYPSIKTYHLPESGNDRLLEADSIPRNWISISLPDVVVLPPDGAMTFGFTLATYSVPVGDYFADVIFDWYNPFYRKGYITVRMHVQNPLGITETDMEPGSLRIYPNPTPGPLNIQIHDEAEENEIIITSINGRFVLIKSFSGNIFRCDLSGYPKGIYIVSVRSKNRIMNRKIILF